MLGCVPDTPRGRTGWGSGEQELACVRGGLRKAALVFCTLGTDGTVSGGELGIWPWSGPAASCLTAGICRLNLPLASTLTNGLPLLT